MAFMDFLSKGIGGMTPAQTTPGIAGEGDVVTAAAKPIGPTWGQALQGTAMYGSKPGSSAPMIAQQMGTNPIQSLQPTPLLETPQDKKKKEGGDDSLGKIAQLIMGLVGGR